MKYWVLITSPYRAEEEQILLNGNLDAVCGWIEENVTRFDKTKIIPRDDEAAEEWERLKGAKYV